MMIIKNGNQKFACTFDLLFNYLFLLFTLLIQVALFLISPINIMTKWILEKFYALANIEQDGCPQMFGFPKNLNGL